jgi:catechol 2,3-dioxygenase
MVAGAAAADAGRMSLDPDTNLDTDRTLEPLPAATRLGTVRLTVTDLHRSIAFYERSLGLQVRSRDGEERAMLGTAADELLELVAEPGARTPGRHAGVYHFALLYADRRELSRALHRLATTRTPIQGASDHGVSEAIYLPDPDGNGIELYADRPREQWPPPQGPGERVGMYTVALDVASLFDLVADDEIPAQAAPGLRVGHVHLHVGDVQRAVAFYSDVLGFDVMVDMPSASFLAAGGYHHHLAVNTWRGEGVPAPPAGTVGLREWELVLPTERDVADARFRAVAAGLRIDERPGGFVVRDPWNLPVFVRRAA